MHHFVVQLQPSQQTALSLRASQYKPASKRKRDNDDEDVEEPPIISLDHDAEAPLPSSNTQPLASLDTPEIAQLRVAGLLPQDEFVIPSPPFPHAPARTSREGFKYTRLQNELAGLDPPLYALNATSKSQPVDRKSERPALRQTHLGVLSTMMHHCLLEGDYHRAGRAWAMILRSHIAGLPIDPRNHGRWGVGAEILLRRGARDQPNRRQNNQDKSGNADSKQFPSNEDALYTQEGFELAREYYERLIVQHPNRKHLQHAVDDRTFYPAMFSLWIYEVSERSKQAEQRSKKDIDGLMSGSISFDDTTFALEGTQARLSAIKDEELRQAREITNRIDQLIVSPPFDKHADLLQLRGMVGLWISDLILKEEFSEQEKDEWEDASEPSEIQTEDFMSNRKKIYSECLRELEESLVFFNRAQTNGQHIEGIITSVQTKIKDLIKRMAKIGE